MGKGSSDEESITHSRVVSLRHRYWDSDRRQTSAADNGRSFPSQMAGKHGLTLAVTDQGGIWNTDVSSLAP